LIASAARGDGSGGGGDVGGGGGGFAFFCLPGPWFWVGFEASSEFPFVWRFCWWATTEVRSFPLLTLFRCISVFALSAAIFSRWVHHVW